MLLVGKDTVKTLPEYPFRVLSGSVVGLPPFLPQALQDGRHRQRNPIR